jgi:hypothetical protein
MNREGGAETSFFLFFTKQRAQNKRNIKKGNRKIFCH